MAEPKELVASAIARAQNDLVEALVELEKIPTFDPNSVAFAAHALNNYLTVTGGTIDLLKRHLENYPDSQVQVWMDGALHATALMAGIVNQLISASANNGAELRFELFDLTGLVDRVSSYYRKLADHKSIRIQVYSAKDVAQVWADRVAVAAVLDNLVSNAIKYSPPGKNVEVRVLGETGWVTCEVHDQGPGLSKDDQAKLFQRGVRLAPQPTGGEPSTGYGLAVAKELIDKLGGTIWCRSELGKGCCFGFRLPTQRETQRDSNSPAPQ